jgi:hypothetical protein
LNTTRVRHLEECDDFVREVVGRDFGVFKYTPWDELIEDICSPDEDVAEDSDSAEGGTGMKAHTITVTTKDSGKGMGTTTRSKGKGVEKSARATEKTTAPKTTTSAQVRSKGKVATKGKVDEEEGQQEGESEAPELEVRTAHICSMDCSGIAFLTSRSSYRARAVRRSGFRASLRVKFVVKGAHWRAGSAIRCLVGDASVIALL